MKLACAMIAGLKSKEQILNVINSANTLSKNELEWYICPDPYVNLNYFDFLKEEKTFVGLLPRINSDGGANIHGSGIDTILKNIKNKYIMICDTDIIITMKNWDDYMLNYLNDKQIIIGSECWSNGHLSEKHIRYPKVPHFYNNENFPIMGPIIIIDKEKHLSTNTSFVKNKLNIKKIGKFPKFISKDIWINGGKIKITNNVLKDIFNKELNVVQNLMGGWRIPFSYLEYNYNGVTLPTTSNKLCHKIYDKLMKNTIVYHYGGGGGNNSSNKKWHGIDKTRVLNYNVFLNICEEEINKQNIKIKFIKISV